MCDTELWALMQRVERLRYRAELLERASVGQPPAIEDFLIELARQSRHMAEGVCAKADALEPSAPCSSCAYREWALALPAAEADLETAA